MPEMNPRRALIRNERLKLFATLINNVAAAFLIGGLITPLIAIPRSAASTTTRLRQPRR